MRPTISATLLALIVLLTACGDDDTADTTTAPTTSTAPAPPAVVIESFAYAEVQEVAVGDQVVVENRDATRHTWTASDGSFDSGPISGGDTFAFVFDEPGDYRFFCGIHPTMTGSITVTG